MPRKLRWKRTKKKIETVQILNSSYMDCIPDRAFEDYKSLKSVNIETDVTAVQGGALGGTITSIGAYAFCGCSALESIVIPNGVKTINDNTFCGCSSLESIVIPNGVITIEGFSFCGCSSLESIKIPNSVKTIGQAAFYDCSSLVSFDIPNGVTTIGGYAFRDCSSLQSIVIPNGVTAIGGDAFFGCSSLKSIVIPNGVTTIGRAAFYYCSSLQLIEVPESVKTIRENAFDRCSTLNQRQENGTNYHPDTETWLRRRFSNLPIHRACYHANNNNNNDDINNIQSSLHLLSTLIQQNTQALAATDAMGMTPLHILCCNPNVTAEMVQRVVEGEPFVQIQKDVTQHTPLQHFLKRKKLLRPGQGTMPSLCHLLESGIKCEDLEILLVLYWNEEIDLSSQEVNAAGLLPYMAAATLSTCGLDLVYTLAMHTNIGMISEKKLENASLKLKLNYICDAIKLYIFSFL